MFCATRPVLGGNKDVGFSFHVLCSRTHFGQYRGLQVLFSSFALPDPFGAEPRASSTISYFVVPDKFSAVQRASGTVFMFRAPRLILGVTESVRSRFHVLRSQTHFRRYRGRRVPFSCFALPGSFSAILGAPILVFMFRATVPILGVTYRDGNGPYLRIVC
jgi:hypothetical protein